MANNTKKNVQPKVEESKEIEQPKVEESKEEKTTNNDIKSIKNIGGLIVL